MLLLEAYEKAIQSIIQPSKFTHRVQTFCPKQFLVDGHHLERIDFTVMNSMNKRIEGIILKQANKHYSDTILYLHGNGSSKLQALNFMNLISRNQVNIVSFDFIGCGNSDDGYLTYGVNEHFDIDYVLREVERYLRLSRISIWGRSMGALTAIFYAAKSKYKITNIVLDTPFQYLSEVVQGVIEQQTSLPSTLAKIVLYMIKRKVQQTLQIKLFDINYVELMRKIQKNIPIFFICSKNDEIVTYQMVMNMYRNVKSHQKQILQIKQNHDEDRSEQVLQFVLKWIKRSNSSRSKRTLKLKIFCQNQENYQIYNGDWKIFGC